MKKICVCILLSACLLTSLVGCGCEHLFATEWSFDGTHHWHICTNEGCEEQGDRAEHDWDAGTLTLLPTAAAPGERTFSCKVCGKKRTESVPGDTTAEQAPWMDALLMQEENYWMTVASAADRFVVKKRNGIVEISNPLAAKTSKRYYTVEEGKYVCYTVADQQVTKAEVTQQAYLSATTLADLQVLPYAAFTYNETAKQYEAAQISVQDVVYESVCLSLLNGRIDRMTFTQKQQGAADKAIVIQITYGSVVADLVLPQVTQ